MASRDDYIPVITRLLDKTRMQKIEWKGTYESTTFICALQGEYSFEIERGRTNTGNLTRKLTMKDREAGEVFVVRAVAPDADSSPENDQFYEILDDLYDLARKRALGIDKKVGQVISILDKI